MIQEGVTVRLYGYTSQAPEEMPRDLARSHLVREEKKKKKS